MPYSALIWSTRFFMFLFVWDTLRVFLVTCTGLAHLSYCSAGSTADLIMLGCTNEVWCSLFVFFVNFVFRSILVGLGVLEVMEFVGFVLYIVWFLDCGCWNWGSNTTFLSLYVLLFTFWKVAMPSTAACLKWSMSFWFVFRPYFSSWWFLKLSSFAHFWIKSRPSISLAYGLVL